MSTVATAPRPLSSFASIATPRASLFGLARKSRPASVICKHGIEQRINSRTVARRNIDEHDITAVLLRNEIVLGQLLAHSRRVGALFIDFVYRNDNRNVGRLRVIERLNGLGHDAVIRGNHENCDIGDLGTARAHRRKGLVTRCVDKRDSTLAPLVSRRDLVCANVLSDTARLALNHVRVTNRIKETSLSVVNVTHNGHHGRPRLTILSSSSSRSASRSMSKPSSSSRSSSSGDTI